MDNVNRKEYLQTATIASIRTLLVIVNDSFSYIQAINLPLFLFFVVRMPPYTVSGILQCLLFCWKYTDHDKEQPLLIKRTGQWKENHRVLVQFTVKLWWKCNMRTANSRFGCSGRSGTEPRAFFGAKEQNHGTVCGWPEKARIMCVSNGLKSPFMILLYYKKMCVRHMHTHDYDHGKMWMRGELSSTTI